MKKYNRQLTRQDIQIIEKIVHTENGVFLARFAVINVGGIFKAKLLTMTSLAVADGITHSTILLANPHNLQKITLIEPLVRAIVSPYSELFFLTSQSPRAPNHK